MNPNKTIRPYWRSRKQKHLLEASVYGTRRCGKLNCHSEFAATGNYCYKRYVGPYKAFAAEGSHDLENLKQAASNAVAESTKQENNELKS